MKTSLDSGIARFALHRPDAANALDVATAKAIEGALKKAVLDGQSGFIIHSANPRVFCGGGDLRAYSKMKTKAEGLAANRSIRKVLQGFARKPLFIVAAVEGEAVGGGCELALACDWIVASTSARFSFRQIGQRLTTGWGGAARLFKRVRPSVGLDWLSTGRPVSAEEALREGLVDQTVPSRQVLRAAETWLEERPLAPDLINAVKSLASASGQGEEKIFEKLWFSEAHRRVLGK